MGVLYGHLVQSAIDDRALSLSSGGAVPSPCDEDDFGLPLLRGQSVDAWCEYVACCAFDESVCAVDFEGVPKGGPGSPFVADGNGAVR